MTPCRPDEPLTRCERCARFAPIFPHEAERRPQIPLIDATKLRIRPCPLFSESEYRPSRATNEEAA